MVHTTGPACRLEMKQAPAHTHCAHRPSFLSHSCCIHLSFKAQRGRPIELRSAHLGGGLTWSVRLLVLHKVHYRSSKCQ